MNSKLPRRIRVMNKVRNRYGDTHFTTTPTHVTIKFEYSSDVAVWLMHHDGIKTGDFTVTITHAQFDKLYDV